MATQATPGDWHSPLWGTGVFCILKLTQLFLPSPIFRETTWKRRAVFLDQPERTKIYCAHFILDRLNYFALADETFDEDTGVLSAVLVKSQGTVLDRETERILTDGGLYAFQVLFTITSSVSPELRQVIAPVY